MIVITKIKLSDQTYKGSGVFVLLLQIFCLCCTVVVFIPPAADVHHAFISSTAVTGVSAWPVVGHQGQQGLCWPQNPPKRWMCNFDDKCSEVTHCARGRG